MRKWKVQWSGEWEGSLVQLRVCRPVPPKSTPHPSFPTPIFRHMILHYYVKTSSSPSAADRTIMEHSLELFLIHASCDKGTCFFFFVFFYFTGGSLLFQLRSQACNLRFPHKVPSFLNPLVYVLWLCSRNLCL